MGLTTNSVRELTANPNFVGAGQFSVTITTLAVPTSILPAVPAGRYRIVNGYTFTSGVGAIGWDDGTTICTTHGTDAGVNIGSTWGIPILGPGDQLRATQLAVQPCYVQGSYYDFGLLPGAGFIREFAGNTTQVKLSDPPATGFVRYFTLPPVNGISSIYVRNNDGSSHDYVLSTSIDNGTTLIPFFSSNIGANNNWFVIGTPALDENTSLWVTTIDDGTAIKFWIPYYDLPA